MSLLTMMFFGLFGKIVDVETAFLYGDLEVEIMSQNITTTTRTKHINVRTKFVKEFCEDGIIKIIFVRSEDNERICCQVRFP